MRFGADPSCLENKTFEDAEEQKLVEWTKTHREMTQQRIQKILCDVLVTLSIYSTSSYRVLARINTVRYFKALGTELPSHIVAPKLVLTPVGYCPEEDGKVVQLTRGIRYAKKRKGPSAPRGKVNWYAAELSKLTASAGELRRSRADLVAKLNALETHQEMQSRQLETQRVAAKASQDAYLRSNHEALAAQNEELHMDSKLRSTKSEVETLKEYLQNVTSERQSLLQEVAMARSEESTLRQEEQARQTAQLRLSRQLESSRAGAWEAEAKRTEIKKKEEELHSLHAELVKNLATEEAQVQEVERHHQHLASNLQLTKQ
eukprot:symbB.v1.2.000333.t1/scaffold22.1/size431876/1